MHCLNGYRYIFGLCMFSNHTTLSLPIIDAIMLIDPYYSAIITNLTKIKGVEATASGMGYTFTGDLSTLPSLLIGLPNSSSWILTPKMYTTPTEDNSTTYNVLFQESLVSLLSR